jgi:hypothetical protein
MLLKSHWGIDAKYRKKASEEIIVSHFLLLQSRDPYHW